MADKIDKIQQQIQALKEQLKKEKAKGSARERKIDTRKKILLGAMLMHWVDTGKITEPDLLKGLDQFLTRSMDRALFGLSENFDYQTYTPTNNKNQVIENINRDNSTKPTDKSKTQKKSSTSNASDKKSRRSRLEESESLEDIEKEFNL